MVRIILPTIDKRSYNKHYIILFTLNVVVKTVCHFGMPELLPITVAVQYRFFYAVSLPLLLGGIVYMLWYMPAPDTPTSVKVNVGLAWCGFPAQHVKPCWL